MERKLMDQDDVIALFVSHSGNQKGYTNSAVDRRPDVENRHDKEIDAIAGPFAIEHTGIDSVDEQGKFDDWFSCSRFGSSDTGKC